MASSLLDSSETFASLTETVGLDVRLRKALQRLGHVRPTLVQSKCLPLAITSGRDLLVRAKTGSGKTLAYCLPLLQKILHSKSTETPSGTSSPQTSSIRGVILVPTKELCSQVFKTLETLVYYCDEVITLTVLTASSSQNNNNNSQSGKAQQELARLRDHPDVLVATPAGLLAQIRKGTVVLKDSLEMLVVDEADLILSFGYANDVTEIMKSMPRICQGLLMSATLSPELNSLKKIVLHTPVVMKLEQEESSQSQGRLSQFYLSLPRRDKNLVVYVFLKLGILQGKGIFFVNTTDGGYRLKLFLEQFHIRSTVLNAELPFRSRMNIIEQFNVGNFDYLIASDESTDAQVESDHDEDEDDDDQDEPEKSKRKGDGEYGVSRGLDFRNVAFVLNVDFPPSTRSYAHRIGRTARGGASGVALSLVEQDSTTQMEALNDVQQDQPRTSGVDAATPSTMTALTVPTGEGITEGFQPSPLDFDLREIEGFRYRVEDVSRAVTKASVKEARSSELRAEVLNSDRLQSHFEENPADLQLLRHDRFASNSSKIQDHLKHVPKYLLPRGMQVANLNRKRKRKKIRKGAGGLARSDNDPLQSFNDGEVNLEGLGNVGNAEGDEDDMPDFSQESQNEPKRQKYGGNGTRKLFANTRDGTGKSTAGRNTWKEKHRKGKYSGKKSKAERKMRDPLGI